MSVTESQISDLEYGGTFTNEHSNQLDDREH